MTPALVADAATPWPLVVVGFGVILAGMFAGAGLVWLGIWLVGRVYRKPDREPGE
ncbi:hypothetical protein J0H58_12835 [bacterium]|nr:hypothetical protein [bacterium]